MRSLVFAAGLILFAAPVFGQKTEATGNEAILQKLEATLKVQADLVERLRIAEANQREIAERLSRIEAKLENAPKAEAIPNFQGRGPDEEALAKITLPENPTKEQVRKYVSDIAAVSQKQNSFSSDDPQVEMLMKVGPANLDVLLDSLSGNRRRIGNMSFYIMPAVKGLAGNEHKEMILKHLAQQPELAEIVLGQGWAADARDVLTEGLRAKRRDLPSDWIKAVASFKDPATYDALKSYLANGNNPAETYKDIKDLPGIELSQEVAESWERVKDEQNPWEVQQMAGIAMEYGRLDALEQEVQLLGGDQQRQFGFMPDMNPRRLILRYTDARGTPDEIRKWYEENKSRLVFDKAAKKFVVRKDQ
jgi:hypothetical protein